MQAFYKNVNSTARPWAYNTRAERHNMSKHTPAPWNIQIDWEDRYPICIIDPTTTNHPQGALHICNVNPNLSDESQANARLIAAAPELLAALEEAAHILENVAIMTNSAEIGKHAKAAREAIAKAQG